MEGLCLLSGSRGRWPRASLQASAPAVHSCSLPVYPSELYVFDPHIQSGFKLSHRPPGLQSSQRACLGIRPYIFCLCAQSTDEFWCSPTWPASAHLTLSSSPALTPCHMLTLASPLGLSIPIHRPSNPSHEKPSFPVSNIYIDALKPMPVPMFIFDALISKMLPLFTVFCPHQWVSNT